MSGVSLYDPVGAVKMIYDFHEKTLDIKYYKNTKHVTSFCSSGDDSNHLHLSKNSNVGSFQVHKSRNEHEGKSYLFKADILRLMKYKLIKDNIFQIK